MVSVLNDRNKQWWEHRKKMYSHQTVRAIGNPKPDAISVAVYGHFICVPFDDMAHWGFETAVGLKMFNRKYPRH